MPTLIHLPCVQFKNGCWMIPDRPITKLEDMEALFKPWSELEKEPRFLPWVVVDENWDPSLLTDPSRIPDWTRVVDYQFIVIDEQTG
eukprot:46880-Eustigmatos_ZCMA.PRE.1